MLESSAADLLALLGHDANTQAIDGLPVLPDLHVAQGQIDGELVQLTLSGALPEGAVASQGWLVVCFTDLRFDSHPLAAWNALTLTLKMAGNPSDSGMVTQMVVCLNVNGVLHRLSLVAAKCPLGSLLCRSVEEVNNHLRWSNRIGHFGTRVFVARNSYRFLWQDPNAAAYCLVSVGYTALECEDPTLVRWISEELFSTITHRLEAMQPEPRFSLLCHAIHHAVALGQVARFEQIVALTMARVQELDALPEAAQNVSVVCLLGGLFYLLTGHRERAGDILWQCDRVFKIAVARYPRNPLHVYFELKVICARAMLARVAYHMALGRRIPPKYLPSDVAAMAGEACRLHGKQEHARFVEQFKQLVARKLEQAAS